MLVTIHQPEHLPWLGFLAKIAAADLWVDLDNVNFRKNYFQNRNRILLDGSPTWVTVPVRATSSTAIADVTIADDPTWTRKYVGRVVDAYGRSPYWESVARLTTSIDGTVNGSRLVELNRELFTWLATAFAIGTPSMRATDLDVHSNKSELLAEICAAVGATTYLSGPSGRDYLDLRPFHDVGVAVRYFDFEHPKYPQPSTSFQPQLSAIDALANVPADALPELLTSSRIADA